MDFISPYYLAKVVADQNPFLTNYRGPWAPNLSFYDRFCPLRHKLVVPTELHLAVLLEKSMKHVSMMRIRKGVNALKKLENMKMTSRNATKKVSEKNY